MDEKIILTLSDSKYFVSGAKISDTERANFVQNVKLFDILSVNSLDVQLDDDSSRMTVTLLDFTAPFRPNNLIGTPLDLNTLM